MLRPYFRGASQMKLMTAVVRPERLPHVKAALFRAAVTGITISRVSGHGGEHEMLEHYRGRTVVLEFREKVRLEMACSDPFVEPTIKAILTAARTGQVGDGKIFVQPLERVIRIRTGEVDTAAVTAVERRALEEATFRGPCSFAYWWSRRARSAPKARLPRPRTPPRRKHPT